MNRFACLLILNCTQFSVLLSYSQSNKPDSTVSRLNDSASMQNNSDPYFRALQNARNGSYEKIEIESQFPGGSNA